MEGGLPRLWARERRDIPDGRVGDVGGPQGPEAADGARLDDLPAPVASDVSVVEREARVLGEDLDKDVRLEDLELREREGLD